MQGRSRAPPPPTPIAQRNASATSASDIPLSASPHQLSPAEDRKRVCLGVEDDLVKRHEPLVVEQQKQILQRLACNVGRPNGGVCGGGRGETRAAGHTEGGGEAEASALMPPTHPKRSSPSCLSSSDSRSSHHPRSRTLPSQLSHASRTPGRCPSPTRGRSGPR